MDKALDTMINNMPEKTGKSLEQWQQILTQERIEKHGAAVKFLKEQHGVTHGFANTIVTLVKEHNKPSEDLVANQYLTKAALKPIYDKLIAIVESFGADIIIMPKKASVSIIRKRQFALIKPATKSRIDLGLKLKDTEVQGRLEGSGPFGAMCTHRVQLENVADIDDDVIGWLEKAYEKSV